MRALSIIGFLFISIMEGSTFAQNAFTVIANSRDAAFSGFSYQSPLNNNMDVAFVARLTTGGEAIYLGNGIANTLIAATGSHFNDFPDLPDQGTWNINQNGHVAFSAYLTGGGEQISIYDGISVNSVLATTTSSFSKLRSPDINLSGQLVHPSAPPAGIYFTDGATTTSIVSGGSRDYGSLPTLNDSGVVAYFQIESGNSSESIRTSDGTTTNIIADTANGLITNVLTNPIINNQGVVAFAAETPSGQSIFTSDGNTLTENFDTSGPFATLGGVGFNNIGELAFSARLDTGTFGIYTGADPIADKVIEIGDQLDGSIVTSLYFRDALNDMGNIAFYAELADGTTGIYVTGVPEPFAEWLIAPVILALTFSRKRRQTGSPHS